MLEEERLGAARGLLLQELRQEVDDLDPLLAEALEQLAEGGIGDLTRQRFERRIELFWVNFELGRHRNEQEVDALRVEQLLELEDHGQRVFALLLLLQIPTADVLQIVTIKEEAVFSGERL